MHYLFLLSAVNILNLTLSKNFDEFSPGSKYNVYEGRNPTACGHHGLLTPQTVTTSAKVSRRPPEIGLTWLRGQVCTNGMF